MAEMKFIGITGGVGAGKSQILDFIKKHYCCEIYLADRVAEEVEQPGTKCYESLREVLDEDVFDPDDGKIDRSKMAMQIFRDATLLEKVNNIVHPAVFEFLMERLQQARNSEIIELFFVEAALLVECGYGKIVDEMWYVYASKEERIARLKQARGYTDEKIAGIMERQLCEEEFRANSDFVIDNSGSLEDAYRQIRKKLEAYTWRE